MTLQQFYTLVSSNETSRFKRRRIALWHGFLSGGMFLADVGVIAATSCITGIAYHLAVYREAGDMFSFLTLGMLAAGIFSAANFLQGEYTATRVFAPRPARTFYLWNLTLVSLLILGFVAKSIDFYSRGSILIFYAATVPALIGLRGLVARASISASRAGVMCLRQIFLFGNGNSIREFTEHYEWQPSGMVVVGCRFITPVRPGATMEEKLASLKVDVAAAINSARSLAPDAIMLMIPWSAAETIEVCVEQFMALPAEIHLGPDRILQCYGDAQLSRFGAFASLRLTRMPLTWFELALKRALDLVIASLALFASTPALVLVAAAIKLDSAGPVFFLQRRYGFNRQPFRIIKFRTMHTMDDGNAVRQATRNDPRVTRVGRWLRRWNIDEVPQLFNVIIGDMSLVGPRPHALSHDREYGRKIAIYARRHNVKPGITGWAQIKGFRGETDTDEKMERRVAHDLHYIENWSLSLDLHILVRTVMSPTAYKNAR